MKSGRLVTDRLAVLPNGVKHYRKNRYKNDSAQNEHEPVQPLLLFGYFGNWRMQI